MVNSSVQPNLTINDMPGHHYINIFLKLFTTAKETKEENDNKSYQGATDYITIGDYY